MTDNTHGQVPEALRLAHIFDNPLPPEWPDMVAAAAELRRQHTRIAELEAQIEALSGVQALSAAPEAIAKLRHLYQNMVNGAVRDTASAKRIAEGLLAPAIEALERATPPAEQQAQAGAVPQGWKAVPVNPTPEMWKAAKSVPDPNPPYPPHYGLVWDAMLAASPTPPAEQQAAPKAAPVEQDDHQILAITTAYEQGVGKGHQAYNSGKEIANPYSPAYRCDLAWQYGYKEGKEQAQREAKATPQQEAQEPALFVSAKQLADLVDPSHATGGSYLPARKTRAGLFTQPLYSAPQPAPAPLSDDVAKDAALWHWLAEYLVGTRTDLDDEIVASKTVNDLRKLVEAAIKQGGKA